MSEPRKKSAKDLAFERERMKLNKQIREISHERDKALEEIKLKDYQIRKLEQERDALKARLNMLSGDSSDKIAAVSDGLLGVKTAIESMLPGGSFMF